MVSRNLIYQRALALEFGRAGLDYRREIEMPIFYRDFTEPIGTRRVDFLVEDKVLVELKALGELEDVHMVQVLNYLKVYKIEIGILINFGERSLNFKRFIL